MSFNFQREYEVHLLLGDPSAAPMWHRDTWSGVFPILQGVARSSRGVPVTSSSQFEGPKNKAVKFGRIGWSAEGHSKWTHSPDTAHRFLLTEVWAPSRGTCAKEPCPPDFLFVLWNQGYFSKEEVTFRDTVLLAVPATDAPAVETCIQAARQLTQIMRAKFHGRMTRPWARPFGKAMFTDCLGDMPTTGLFRVGPVHKQIPGNDMLVERWEPLYEPGV